MLLLCRKIVEKDLSATSDPEPGTQSGALAGFTVAVSHRSKTNGEWQDVTDGFFAVTCWNSHLFAVLELRYSPSMH